MYAAIHYTAEATTIQVLDDVVKILTGTTDISSLSTSVITQADSFITFSSSVAGWEIHDDLRLSGTAPSNQKVVLKAAMTDMPGQFKYIMLDGTNLSPTNLYKANSVIRWYPYESWNEVTHTGVFYQRKIGNSFGTTDINTLQTDSSNINVIYSKSSASAMGDCYVYLSASSKHLFAYATMDNNTRICSISFITEHTRNSAWDTVGNGYKNIIYNSGRIVNWTGFYSSSTTTTPIAIKPVFPTSPTVNYMISDGSPSVFPNNYCYINTSYSSNIYERSVHVNMGSSYYPYTILDSNKQFSNYIIPFGFHNVQAGNFGGDVSSVAGVYLGSYVGAPNDKAIIGSTTYRIWVLPSSLGNDIPNSSRNEFRLMVLEG